jgi:hypothetical protein
MANLTEFLNLSESILDPIQENLSPDLWKNNKLKPTVKTHIKKRLESWLKNHTNKSIKRMFIIGSMTGHQYTPQSDIDVNFVIDIPDEKLKEIGKLMMVELNEKPLPRTEHPVNYFISNKVKKEWKTSGSIYDMDKDKWIVQPKKEEQGTVITNYRAVTEIARFFIAGLDLMLSEYYADVAAYENYSQFIKGLKEKEDKEDLQKLINIKLQEIVADIDGVFIAKHMLRALRKEAFEENEGLEINTKIDIRDTANNSINNLIYKYVERLGYFPKIKNILDESDKWNKLLQTGT